MKCIKAIKASKEAQIGEIKRVDDRTAQNMVGSYWQYISKSEWKSSTRKPVEAVNDQITDSVTVSEKQLKRKKSK